MNATDLDYLVYLRRLLAALAFALLIGTIPFVYAEQAADFGQLLQAIEDIKRDYDPRLSAMDAEIKRVFVANNEKHAPDSRQFADAKRQLNDMETDRNRVRADRDQKVLEAKQGLLKARGALLDLRRAKASGEAAKASGLAGKPISGEVFDKDGRHGAADMPDVPTPDGRPVQLVMPEAPTRRKDAPKEIRESLRSQALDQKRNDLEKEGAALYVERNRLARDPNATASQIQENQDAFKQHGANTGRLVMDERVLQGGSNGFVVSLKIKEQKEPPSP